MGPLDIDKAFECNINLLRWQISRELKGNIVALLPKWMFNSLKKLVLRSCISNASLGREKVFCLQHFPEASIYPRESSLDPHFLRRNWCRVRTSWDRLCYSLYQIFRVVLLKILFSVIPFGPDDISVTYVVILKQHMLLPKVIFLN